MEEAKKIANTIKQTPTELRGDLFRDIAIELSGMSQGYTATLFHKIAHEYGFKKQDK